MKEKINYFYNPVRVIQGNGCVHELPTLAEEILPHGGNILWLAWSESVFELEVCKQLKKNNAYELRHMHQQELCGRIHAFAEQKNF